MKSAKFLPHMNRVSVSPTDGLLANHNPDFRFALCYT